MIVKSLLRNCMLLLVIATSLYGVESSRPKISRKRESSIEQPSSKPSRPKISRRKRTLQKSESTYDYEILSQIKIAAFLPTDSVYQRVYSDTALYTFETSVKVWKGLAPFASVGFLCNSGNLIDSDIKLHSTRLYMVPIGLGLKYYVNVKNWQPYLGAGLLVSYNRVTTTYPYIPSPQTQWGAGGLFKLGALSYLTESVFVDFFLDYNLLRVNFKNKTSKNVQVTTSDLSGFALGASLGMRF